MLTECAARYTQGMSDLANLAHYAERGMLPIAGTILDQPAWFVDFWHNLQSHLTRIENEKLERVRRR